jgi:hypothetical protein
MTNSVQELCEIASNQSKRYIGKVAVSWLLPVYLDGVKYKVSQGIDAELGFQELIEQMDNVSIISRSGTDVPCN